MTTLPESARAWFTEQTMAIVAYSTRGGPDCYQGIVEILGEVGARYGDRGTFAITCSLAACITSLDGYDQVGNSTEGFYGFEVQEIATGRIVAPEEVHDGEDLMAGMRFVTAWANEDRQQLNALFNATPGPVFFGLCMLVGASVRHKQEEAS